MTDQYVENLNALLAGKTIARVERTSRGKINIITTDEETVENKTPEIKVDTPPPPC